MLLVFNRILSQATSSFEKHLTVADFNASVLHLATASNLLLTWASYRNLCVDKKDLEINSDLLSALYEELRIKNVLIDAISGGWNASFVDIALSSSFSPAEMLILASETIYSPMSTRAFTTTLMDLLKRAKERGIKAKALVAAKTFYFGTGGNKDDFLGSLKEMGGSGVVMWESEGTGVKRAILEVELYRG